MPEASLSRCQRVSTLLAPDRVVWLSVFLVVLPLYALGAHWGEQRMNDTDAANWPAWWLVHHGTFFLDGFKSGNPWFVHAGGHLVSNRMGGVILFGVPLQAAFGGLDLWPNAIGALTAVLATSLSTANMAVVFKRLGAPSQLAFTSAMCLAFGTAVWTVSSAELWPHTADLFWISLAFLALTRDRTLVAGLLLAPLILTRAHLAVVIAVIGIWLAWRRRSVRVLLHFAAPALLAVLALVAWNDFMYGTPSLVGGYAGKVEALPGHGDVLLRYLLNLAGAVGSPLRGVLLYTPLVVVAILCIPVGWRRSPDWARAALVGGALYEGVQHGLNRYSGGTSFYSNRLVLELLLLASPLVVLGYQEWRERGPHRATITRALAMTSIGIHALGAFLPDTYFLHPQHWTTWGPVAALHYETGPAVAIIVVAVAAGVIVTLWPLRGYASGWPLRRPAPAGESAAQPEPALTSR